MCALSFFLFVKEHQRRQVSLTNGICTPGKKPTRRSVEHSTPTPMAPRYISLAYLIYFRMIKFYPLPMLAECGKGSISPHSPVTYQVEMDQCKSL